MRRPRVSMAKNKRLKILTRSNVFLCQQSLKFFLLQFFLIGFTAFVLQRLDPLAAVSRRLRQLESSGAAASRKIGGAPPSQSKLWGAAAAKIFTARRGL